MSSVGNGATTSDQRATTLAIDISISSEVEQTFREANISVIQRAELPTTDDLEDSVAVDCLLLSQPAYDEYSSTLAREHVQTPLLLVLEEADDSLSVRNDAVKDYVHMADLQERPSLVARRINTVVTAARHSNVPQASQLSSANEAAPTVTEEELTQLRLLFENAPDTILVHDREGAIYDVNQTAVDTLGYSRPELTSMEIRDVEVGAHPEELLAAWSDPPTDEAITVEGEHRHADGTTHPVEVWVNSVEVAGEVRFIAIARDITEQKRYENRLETQRDNLQTLNQVVRHDIRNDLQLVSLYAELLEDHVDEDGRSHVQKLQDGIENAVDLTTTARELAEIMLTSSVENQRVNLAQVVNQQVEETRESYPGAVVRVDGSVPAVDVVGNEMLDSVFRNLLKNAIQHNDSEQPVVAVSGTVSDDTVAVHVADNGSGVPDSQKTEIFGRGERGLDSEGTGIGLYLVQSLVDSVGGDVWVGDADASISIDDGQTLDPGGAVFTVELPLAE